MSENYLEKLPHWSRDIAYQLGGPENIEVQKEHFEMIVVKNQELIQIPFLQLHLQSYHQSILYVRYTCL